MRQSAILTYHSIDSSGSVISISPEIFRNQMELLAEASIPVVPLTRIRETRGAVALTFDDGFANFADHAYPVLEQHGYAATVFLVSGYCGLTNDWIGQSPLVPRLPLLSWPAVQQMSGELVKWGAHSVNHPNLAQQSSGLVEAEMRQCRACIEDKTGAEVRAFAYPYGKNNAKVRAAAAEHFEIACGTRLRYVDVGADQYDLPRLDAYYLRDSTQMKNLLNPGGRAYIGLRRFLREGRAWLSR